MLERDALFALEEKEQTAGVAIFRCPSPDRGETQRRHLVQKAGINREENVFNREKAAEFGISLLREQFLPAL